MKTVLQHGTILTDVDVDKMFSVLRVPNEKIRDKLISDVKERVTSVKHVLNKQISFNKAASAMKKGFEEEFDVKLVTGSLTPWEEDLARKFESECFGNPDWNHKK